MPEVPVEAESVLDRDDEHGFESDVRADTLPPGLDEAVIQTVWPKKGEPPFMLE